MATPSFGATGNFNHQILPYDMAEVERQHHVSLKFKHVKVQVISGLFFNEQTDIVVNSTSQKLQLQDGMGSKALLQAAGSNIQHALSSDYPNGAQLGEIAITGGHNLYCALVYHCCLGKWSESAKDSAEKILVKIVSSSLKQANETDNVQSITFPALGRGANNFPAKILAKIMFQCVTEFEEGLGTELTLKDVRFVIYPTDEDSIEAFIEEAKQRSKNVATTMEYSADIGNVKVTLLQGSMTKQVCDVVVNEVIENLDLSNSPISEIAGPGLEKSLKQAVSGEIGYGQIAVTGNAGLQNCKAVYHGAMPQFTEETKSDCKGAINMFVMQCLMEATETGYTTIAFPPLGTDLKNFPPELSAEAIQGSIIEYISGNIDTTTVKRIFFIVQPSATKTFKAFKDKMFPYMRGRQRLDQTLIARAPCRPAENTPVNIPLNSLQIRNTPVRRGTRQWLLEKYEDQIKTPSYWTYFPGGQRVRKLKVDPMFASKPPFKLQDVEPKTLQAIRSLVEKTWNEEYFSHGRDALGLGDLDYEKIRVIGVKRLENLNLYEKYSSFRQHMFGKVLSQPGVLSFPSAEKLPNSKGELLTTSVIDQSLTKEIYREVNEHYVFHGTKQESIEIILATGLDSRMAGPNAMFGQGVYAAESSTKADQYADYRDKRDMKTKNMFLTRMCMGDICIVDEPLSMKRPPCKSCLSTICDTGCRNTKLFDSVLVDGQWLFREMIVYDHSQCYPEYLISYQRVK